VAGIPFGSLCRNWFPAGVSPRSLRELHPYGFQLRRQLRTSIIIC
jgi:hypothetical protein